MTRLVTIFGGSGFVGRYVVRRMALEGWRVRVATRRPNEALFVRPYGTTGQVEPVLCNICNQASVANALEGADAAVNCAGSRNDSGVNNFRAVHVDGAHTVARLARHSGLGRLVHVSAVGADAASDCDYLRTKALGESAVLEQLPDAVIMRPCDVYGAEDRFFNNLAALTRFGPVFPLAAAATRVQPVYVDDLANAVVQGVLGKATGVYELGGTQIATRRQMTDRMLAVIHRRRVVLNMPGWLAWLMAFDFDMLHKLSLGLVKNPLLTRDQLRGLARDRVVSDTARGLGELGITPVAMASVLPGYLWRFRPSGQYDQIKRSAANLRS